MARTWPERGPNVAQTWPERGPNVDTIEEGKKERREEGKKVGRVASPPPPSKRGRTSAESIAEELADCTGFANGSRAILVESLVKWQQYLTEICRPVSHLQLEEQLRALLGYGKSAQQIAEIVGVCICRGNWSLYPDAVERQAKAIRAASPAPSGASIDWGFDSGDA